MESKKLPVQATRELSNCSLRKLEGEGNERKFSLSFSSEEPYERYYGTEILDHTDECVDFTRLQTIGVVLFNHNTDKVVGKILEVRLKDGRGEATIEFDTDDDAEVIYQKVSSGTLKGVSVGYIIKNYEEVAKGEKSKDGRFEGPCYIATKWMPFEISIVSVPADATVGVGRELEMFQKKEETPNYSAYERQIQINKNSYQEESK